MGVLRIGGHCAKTIKRLDNSYAQPGRDTHLVLGLETCKDCFYKVSNSGMVTLEPLDVLQTAL
jgi:hypothetical protein